MKTLALVIQFFLLLSNTFAQLPPTNFYRITNEEGLSQATVNVLYKDRDGFLWIGTDDGLNRFDGKKIKTYYTTTNLMTALQWQQMRYMAFANGYNRCLAVSLPVRD